MAKGKASSNLPPLLVAGLLGALLIPASARTELGQPYQARLEVERRGGGIEVVAFASGPAGAAIRYHLASWTESRAGVASSGRHGRATLDRKGRARLAEVHLDGALESYRITLRVYDQRAMLAEAELTRPGRTKPAAVQPVPAPAPE